MHTALYQQSFIRKKQSKIWVQNKFDSSHVLSIPLNLTHEYIQLKDTLVNKVLKKGVNPTPVRDLKKDDISYAFKDNRYHFYVASDSGNGIFQKTLLQLDNFLEHNISNKGKRFVFSCDSIFYFLNPQSDSALGPFVLNGLDSQGCKILDCQYANEPFNRYILKLKDSLGIHKALFVPDSSMVISEYQTIENNFLETLVEKKEPKQDGYKVPWGWLLFGLSLLYIVISRYRLK